MNDIMVEDVIQVIEIHKTEPFKEKKMRDREEKSEKELMEWLESRLSVE